MNEVVEIRADEDSEAIIVCAPSRDLAVRFAVDMNYITEQEGDKAVTTIVTDNYKGESEQCVDLMEFAKFEVSCRVNEMYNANLKHGKDGTVWMMQTGDGRLLYNDPEQGITEWS